MTWQAYWTALKRHPPLRFTLVATVIAFPMGVAGIYGVAIQTNWGMTLLVAAMVISLLSILISVEHMRSLLQSRDP